MTLSGFLSKNELKERISSSKSKCLSQGVDSILDWASIAKEFIKIVEHGRKTWRCTHSPISGPGVIKLFSCSTQLSMKCFPLIYVKMPTIVGILTCMSGKNNILGLTEP